jgi:hypothetical protein
LAFLRWKKLQCLKKQRWYSLKGLENPVSLMMHRRKACALFRTFGDAFFVEYRGKVLR